jgi:hypothetical protein
MPRNVQVRIDVRPQQHWCVYGYVISVKTGRTLAKSDAYPYTDGWNTAAAAAARRIADLRGYTVVDDDA